MVGAHDQAHIEEQLISAAIALGGVKANDHIGPLSLGTNEGFRVGLSGFDLINHLGFIVAALAGVALNFSSGRARSSGGAR